MKILVIGGAGFIGSHTVKTLLAAGHVVTVFDSFEHGHRDIIRQLLPPKSIIRGDIRNPASVNRAMSSGFDSVIHFAGYIEAGESVEQPGKFFLNNTTGSINVLNAMIEHNVHQIVFSSTAAVYGNPKTSPIPETAPKIPTNPYGTSKLLVEQAIADFTHFTPIKATILRYFNAAGADSGGKLGENHHPETHLIPLILQVPLGLRPHITIFGTDYPTLDGTAIRDYIHVEDLAMAHLMAVETQPTSQSKLRTYNVGSGRGYSVNEVIAMCRRCTGHPIPTQNALRRLGDPVRLIADSRLIQTELGWKPRRSDLESIVSDAWNWLNRSNVGYNTSIN